MAEGPNVATIKAGLLNGHALMNEVIAYDEATLEGLNELTLEDVAEQVGQLAGRLEVMAEMTERMPIASAQDKRDVAATQYKTTLDGTARHQFTDQLYTCLDEVTRQHAQTLARRRLLSSELVKLSRILFGVAKTVNGELVPVRQQLGEHAQNAVADARGVQDYGEKYGGIL